MGIFTGVLLASDYDGTLANGANPIPARVFEAVRFFRQEGGLFTVCTGRALQAFRSWDTSLVNAPVILANGGLFYDFAKEKIVRLNGIAMEGDEPLQEIARRFPGVAVEMYGTEETFVIHPQERTKRHFAALGIEKTTETEMVPGRTWMKCMVSGETDEIAAVQAFLREKYPETGFLPTDGNFLEILQHGVNKGWALRKLAAMLRVSMENVYAAGDGYNDCDMLRAAAGAFVPENGDRFAKECATHVVCANTQGAIANVIDILTKKYGGKGV